MTSFEEKILNILLKTGALTQETIKGAEANFEKSKLTLEGYLGQKFKISSKVILEAKSKIASVPAFSYDESKSIPHNVLSIIPREAVEQYQMVPIKKEGKKLFVGMVDPTNFKAQEALRFVLIRSELIPVILVISDEDFRKIFSLYRGLHKEVKSVLAQLEQSLREEPKERGGKLSRVTESVVKDAPITKMVAVILKHAIEGKASDIHIEPTRSDTKVRFRLDGILSTSLLLPSSIHNSIVARIKILASLRLDETRIPQDGRFSTQLNGKSIDFRVSTFPTSGGEKIVMRVLDTSTALLDFPKLGLSGINLKRLEKALAAPFGMILLSGPTGSGKTTTLYAALSKINKESVNIVSLEDPIEYYMEGVNQSQIRPEIKYTFASGLRHVLRQDPDIIMVGEIRDSETAGLATQAALTGHLVFSTIHTNNAIGVIPRLINMGVSSFLIPSSLTLAMAQRLVGRLCSYCKKEIDPHPNIVRMFEDELAKLSKEVLKEFNISKPYKIWNSEGCARCNNKKTKGRIAIYEVLDMTPELKAIILEKPYDVEIMREAERQGMITMKQDGIIKVLQGLVSIEEVLRKVEES